MNSKYIKHIVPAAALLLAVGLNSCTKDLDVTPIDPSTTMTVDEVGLYTKCYANMALAGNTGADGDCDIDGLDGGTTGFVRQMWNANELTTDEAICAWGDPGIPQFNENRYDASHPMLQGFYYRLYGGINYCNHYLDVCKGIDATREAEVRFLRALYYYHLMDCFGNVPFSTAVSTESAAPIARAELFTWIETELKEIVGSMLAPAVRKSSDNGYGRADQDAVNLLLARMYLNAEVYTGTARWQDAKTYAEKVINGPHKLWTTGTGKWSAYQMLFMGDNGESGASQEAILPLYQEAGNRARSQFIAKFFPNNDAPKVNIADMVKAAGDDRALFFGKGRDLVVETTSEYTSGYAVGKFRNTYSNGGNPHNSKFVDTDYFLMRSAEAYLIAAEADARLNGGNTTATGKGYIDAIRQRANNNDLKDSYNLDQILDERARELYHEGFRRTDLIRYGYYGGDKSGEYLWDWKGGIKNGGQAIAAYLNLFAIPAKDMNANPKLKGHQNPGY